MSHVGVGSHPETRLRSYPETYGRIGIDAPDVICIHDLSAMIPTVTITANKPEVTFTHRKPSATVVRIEC